MGACSTKSKIKRLISKNLKGEKSKGTYIQFKNGIQTLSKKPCRLIHDNEKCFIDTSEAPPIDQKIFRENSQGKSGYDGKKDRRKILGNDESSEWPYCSIGKIKFFSDGKEFFGSGTLIGPNVVLTCAHNVYDLETKTEHYNIEFFPALNNGIGRHSSKVVRMKYPDGYKKYDINDPNQYLDDYAILFLEKNLGDYYGYLGIKVFNEDSKNFEVSLYGYSGCTKGDKGKNMIGMEGHVNLEESLYHYRNIDTYYGQSGSSLFKYEGNEYLIAGVHVGSFNGFNQAVKINTERLLKIKEFLVFENYSTKLDLNWKLIGAEGMRHLSTMNLPQLQILNLRINKIGDEGMKHLSTINLPQLQTLNLNYNSIGAKGMKYLSTMNLPQLQTLDLYRNSIGDEGMKHLSTMNLPQLQTLGLYSNSIGPEGMKHLSTMNLPQLQTLDLDWNKIRAEGMKHLSTMNLPLLQTLNLYYNSIGAEGMKHLSTMNLPQLQTLDLYYIGKYGGHREWP